MLAEEIFPPYFAARRLEAGADNAADRLRNRDGAVVKVERGRAVDHGPVVQVANADPNVGWNAVTGRRPSYGLDAPDPPASIDVLDGPSNERAPPVEVLLSVAREESGLNRLARLGAAIHHASPPHVSEGILPGITNRVYLRKGVPNEPTTVRSPPTSSRRTRLPFRGSVCPSFVSGRRLDSTGQRGAPRRPAPGKM